MFNEIKIIKCHKLNHLPALLSLILSIFFTCSSFLPCFSVPDLIKEPADGFATIAFLVPSGLGEPAPLVGGLGEPPPLGDP